MDVHAGAAGKTRLTVGADGIGCVGVFRVDAEVDLDLAAVIVVELVKQGKPLFAVLVLRVGQIQPALRGAAEVGLHPGAAQGLDGHGVAVVHIRKGGHAAGQKLEHGKLACPPDALVGPLGLGGEDIVIEPVV